MSESLCFLSWAPRKRQIWGGMLHPHVIKSSPSCGALATPSPTVGRVGHEWRHAPPHTLNASQPIFWLCYDFYPILGVSHARKGSQDYPLTLRNQSTKQDSSKRAEHQLSLQKNNFFQILFIYFGCARSSLCIGFL